MSVPGVRNRPLGARDGAALVISTVIGAGIFTVPAVVATLAGSGRAFLSVWVVGGLLALAGALTYAELATRMPQAGGEYVYLREAFGPLSGFLSGWTSFVAGFSGAIAASAVGFAAYLGALVPQLRAEPWFVADAGPLTVTLSPGTAVALLLIALFTVIAARGMDAGRRATNLLAMLLVIAMLGFIVLGGIFVDVPAAPRGGATVRAGLAAALVPVMFTYSGWNAAAYVASEFAEPRRTIPRALIGGTAVVILLYLGVNAIFLRALGAPGVGATPIPATAAAQAAFGSIGEVIITSLVLVALASSVCAMVVTGPRIYMQMARDGAMPAAFGRTRERDDNPLRSIVAQSVWSGALVLTGTFEALVTYTGVAIVVFSAGAVGSVFIFRRRQSAAPYRVPAYPLVPLTYLAASAWMLVATIRHSPGAALAGVTLIAAGVPFYWWQRGRGRAAGEAALSVARR